MIGIFLEKLEGRRGGDGELCVGREGDASKNHLSNDRGDDARDVRSNFMNLRRRKSNDGLEDVDSASCKRYRASEDREEGDSQGVEI